MSVVGKKGVEAIAAGRAKVQRVLVADVVLRGMGQAGTLSLGGTGQTRDKRGCVNGRGRIWSLGKKAGGPSASKLDPYDNSMTAFHADD